MGGFELFRTGLEVMGIAGFSDQVDDRNLIAADLLDKLCEKRMQANGFDLRGSGARDHQENE